MQEKNGTLIRSYLAALCSLLLPVAAIFIEQKAIADDIDDGSLSQMAAIISKVTQADNQLYKDMKLVSEGLNLYYQHHGHLPNTPPEEEEFIQVVAENIQENPYTRKATDPGTHEKRAIDTTVRISIISDSSACEQTLERLKKSPPGSWHGDPGSIHVTTDGHSYYYIWGASADWLPIRDSQHDGVPRIVSHRIDTEHQNIDMN